MTRYSLFAIRYSLFAIIVLSFVIFNIGCSSDVGGDPKQAAAGTGCIDGFCEDVSNEINVEEAYKEVKLDKDTEQNVQLGDNVTIEIAKGSVQDDKEVNIYHGVDFEALGKDKNGIANSENLNNSEYFMLDLIEVSAEIKSFNSALGISFRTSSKNLDAMNAKIKESFASFTGFKKSEDLCVLYFDKTEGQFVEVQHEYLAESDSLKVRTQTPGVYAIAFKKNAFDKVAVFLLTPETRAQIKTASNVEAEKKVTSSDNNTGSSAGLNTSAGSSTQSYPAIPQSKSAPVASRAIAAGRPDMSEAVVSKNTVSNTVPGGIPYDHYPAKFPTEFGDESLGFDNSSCSGMGFFPAGTILNFLNMGSFREACFYHDWCNAYGLETYGRGKNKCDMRFLADTLLGCINPFNKFICVKIPYTRKKICIYNPLYVLCAEITIPLCVISSFVAWGAVSWKSELKPHSGCWHYDYYRIDSLFIIGANQTTVSSAVYGLLDDCPFGRIEALSLRDGNSWQIPGNSVKLLSVITGSLPAAGGDAFEQTWAIPVFQWPQFMNYFEHYQSVRPNSIDWSIYPPIDGLSVSSSNLKEATWTIPSWAASGDYTITASLKYDDAHWFTNSGYYQDYTQWYTKTIKITVVSPEVNVADAFQFGGARPDYIKGLSLDADGNFYAVVSYGSSQSVVTGQYCRTEWCGSISNLYRCRRCRNIYGDIPVRTDNVVKFDSNMNQLWSKTINNGAETDVAVIEAGKIACLSNNVLSYINAEGEVLLETSVALQGYTPSKVLVSPAKDIFIVYTGEKIFVRKYNSTTMEIVSESYSSETGISLTDAVIADSSLYLLGSKSSGSDSLMTAEKYDINLSSLWSKTYTLPAGSVSGKLAAASNGAVLFTGITTSGYFSNNPAETAPAVFLMSLDQFGNKRYINMIGGAVSEALPAPDGFYLPSEAVHPLIAITGDTVMIAAGARKSSGTGLNLFRCSAETGNILSAKSLANSSSGSIYSRGVYSAGDSTNMKLMIYGSTSGTIAKSEPNGAVLPNYGALDCFTVKIEEKI